MINSRDISLLRPDVRANVEALIAECKKHGLKILITNTVRDNEYQAYLYAQGRTRPGGIVTNSKTTTFHGAGLAVDFCQNIKGREYEADFMLNVATIAKAMGFTWGGDWKSIVDKPHLQWDNHGKATHKNAPTMPLYKFEEDDMTQADFDKMMDNWLARQNAKPIGATLKLEYEEAIKAGITDGSKPNGFATRAQAAIMVLRATKDR